MPEQITYKFEADSKEKLDLILKDQLIEIKSKYKDKFLRYLIAFDFDSYKTANERWFGRIDISSEPLEFPKGFNDGFLMKI